MIKKDYLENHKELEIYQDSDMFLINSDTTVLGEFLEVYRNDTILDVGTNTGALLIYASRFKPKKMIGIDINEKALELAKKNMELNNIDNASFICESILNYKSEPVDVIICNPPYFKTKEDNTSKNYYKTIAKHENGLTLDKLVKAISLNLKDNGTFYFLHLSPRLDDVLMELRKNNLQPKEIKFVYDQNKEYSNVFLVKCKKNANPGLNVLKPVIIKR